MSRFDTMREVFEYIDRKNAQHMTNDKKTGFDMSLDAKTMKRDGPIGPTGPSLKELAGMDGGPTGFGKEAVGSLASDQKGSGARFNAGKVAVDLIPVWIIAEWATHYQDTPEQVEAVGLLIALGEWQKDGHSASYILREFQGDWTTDCAAVFDYGKKKYAAWNWAKGMNWSVPTGCAVRHLLAILNGEKNDPESGLPHRGHVACNLVMLAQYEQTFKEGDDRPVKWLATSAKPDIIPTPGLLLERTTTLDLNGSSKAMP